MIKGFLKSVGILFGAVSLFTGSLLVYGSSQPGVPDQNREIIGTTHMVGRKAPNRTVYTVQDWKLKIYKDHNVDLTWFLTLEAITQTECGNPLGFCDNGSDGGPFQMNRSHVGYYKDTDKFMKSKDYNSLFAYQLRWTMDRLKRLKPVFCKEGSLEGMVKCLGALHNGNNSKACDGKEWKYCYADRVWEMRKKLKDFYFDKY